MAAHARLDAWNRLLASGLLPTLPTERAEETLAGARGLLALNIFSKSLFQRSMVLAASFAARLVARMVNFQC